MIPIYLCDDNLSQLNYIGAIIKNHLLFHEFNQKFICSTTDPYKLLKKVSESKETGLYFLDIDLKSEINGLELAQEIRKHDPRGYIVFITAHSEMAALTFSYRVEAMDFILKDDPEQLRDKIFQCMQTSAKTDSILQLQNNSIISLKIKQETILLNANDIVFIETDHVPHKLMIHLSHEIKQVSVLLKELQAALDSRFFRCHKSYLINLTRISSYCSSERTVLFDNGELCIVSLRKVARLKAAIKATI